jgi:phosphoglucosamine mutase
VVDGDQIMALIAERWARSGRLTGGALVTTVMSNLALERWLGARGVATLRTKVGDRYVVERMRTEGCNVGGEQSGHVIMTDFTTTGDGLIAALQVLAALIEAERPASEALRLFAPTPQALRSLRYDPARNPLAAPEVQAAIRMAERQLDGAGRLVIRPSGTEPVIRVMVEAEDDAVMKDALDAVCEAVSAAS